MYERIVAMRTSWHATILVLMLIALAACSDTLPPPHVVAEAPQLARVAELLKQPPLRPLPATMAELHAPFPIAWAQFADAAGVALVFGPQVYAVVDIGTDEVIASGKSHGGGAVSPNGRVLAIPVYDGVELRAADTGEVLVELPKAKAEGLFWVGAAGVVHAAPANHWFGPTRLVYRDLATGLESNLALASGIDLHGVLPVPGRADHLYIAANLRLYDVQLAQGAEGVTATVVASHGVHLGWTPSVDQVFAGDRFVGSGDVSLRILALPSLAADDYASDGVSVEDVLPTGDADRAMLRLFVVAEPFMDYRDFYYSLSRRRLAPLPKDALPRDLQYVRSLRIHVAWDEDAIRVVALPPAGDEGEFEAVLAATRAEMLAAHKATR